MDQATFQNLLSPAGQEILHAAETLTPREENFLRDFAALSRIAPPDLARAALEIAILRGIAARKFSTAHQMYFTREALEQASPEEVTVYRSQRYQPFGLIADLGCSIGSDTLALARYAPTMGIDLDPLRLLMAQENIKGNKGHGTGDNGISQPASFIQANLLHPLPLAPSPIALFFDPARRAEHRRAFSVEQYHPPLSVIRSWLERFPALGVKISPGVNLSELAEFDCEVEFISLRGELKEAVLWFGPLRTPTARRATILPGPFSLQSTINNPHSTISNPQTFLYEPDPAVLRAGLVTSLAEMLAAAQLDPDIAYLTSLKQTPTPFANGWAIEDWFPFNLKRLRAYLRERGIGRVVVKKRGSPLTPEALIRDLRLTGDLERTIFLTHLRGQPIVVVGRPDPTI